MPDSCLQLYVQYNNEHEFSREGGGKGEIIFQRGDGEEKEAKINFPGESHC